VKELAVCEVRSFIENLDCTKVREMKQILRHEGIWGVEIKIHVFWNLEYEKGDLPASHAGCINPQQKSARIHVIGSVSAPDPVLTM